MSSSINAFSNELKNIRTGRVSPDILKNILIESLAPKNYNLKVGQNSEYFYNFYNLDKNSLLKKVLKYMKYLLMVHH